MKERLIRRMVSQFDPAAIGRQVAVTADVERV
jgi:hypothetical protein